MHLGGFHRRLASGCHTSLTPWDVAAIRFCVAGLLLLPYLPDESGKRRRERGPARARSVRRRIQYEQGCFRREHHLNSSKTLETSGRGDSIVRLNRPYSETRGDGRQDSRLSTESGHADAGTRAASIRARRSLHSFRRSGDRHLQPAPSALFLQAAPSFKGICEPAAQAGACQWLQRPRCSRRFSCVTDILLRLAGQASLQHIGRLIIPTNMRWPSTRNIRSLVSTMLVVLLSLTSIIAAAETNVCRVSADPSGFDHQQLTLEGIVAGLRKSTSRSGRKEMTFLLRSPAGCGGVIVYAQEPATLSNGDHLQVEGIFETQHHRDGLTFYNEMQATKITTLPR
jgi:hypothetical protein